MTASELYLEAVRRGLRLEPRGEKLAVIPARLCAPDFTNVLRQHKLELLSWLEGRAARLRQDEIPWLHVSKQILSGEFEGCDRSMCESLIIGLRSIGHPLCRRALARIKANGRPNR